MGKNFLKNTLHGIIFSLTPIFIIDNLSHYFCSSLVFNSVYCSINSGTSDKKISLTATIALDEEFVADFESEEEAVNYARKMGSIAFKKADEEFSIDVRINKLTTYNSNNSLKGSELYGALRLLEGSYKVGKLGSDILILLTKQEIEEEVKGENKFTTVGIAERFHDVMLVYYDKDNHEYSNLVVLHEFFHLFNAQHVSDKFSIMHTNAIYSIIDQETRDTVNHYKNKLFF